MQNLNISLKGDWDEHENKYFTIRAKQCTNNSEHSICKSEEEIKKYFKIKYLEAFYLEKSFDLNNFENPISLNVKNYFAGIFQRRYEKFFDLFATFEKLFDLSQH